MNEEPSRVRRKYFAVDKTGSVVCNTSYTATCPSQAAKRFSTAHPLQEAEGAVRGGSLWRYSRCARVQRARPTSSNWFTRDKGRGNRGACDRYLAAAGHQKAGSRQVTEDGRPRIWSYLVYRLPSGQSTNCTLKGIYTSTFSRRLK